MNMPEHLECSDESLNRRPIDATVAAITAPSFGWMRLERVVVNPLLETISEPAVPVSFLASCLSGTLYTAITWWLDHQQQKTPEEVGRLVRKLMMPAMFSVLGIDPTQLSPQRKQEHM